MHSLTFIFFPKDLRADEEASRAVASAERLKVEALRHELAALKGDSEAKAAVAREHSSKLEGKWRRAALEAEDAVVALRAEIAEQLVAVRGN